MGCWCRFISELPRPEFLFLAQVRATRRMPATNRTSVSSNFCWREKFEISRSWFFWMQPGISGPNRTHLFSLSPCLGDSVVQRFCFLVAAASRCVTDVYSPVMSQSRSPLDLVRLSGFPGVDRLVHLFIGGSELHGAKVGETDDTDLYGIYLE